jgi:hypothetical protein
MEYQIVAVERQALEQVQVSMVEVPLVPPVALALE